MMNSPQKFLKIWAGLALLLALTACGGSQPAELVVAQSALEREPAPSVAESAQAELSAGDRAFALDLYQALRVEDGNLFYSPYSLSTALAMTYAGARENTARQMAETLHFTLPQEQLHPAFNALDLDLTAPDDDFTLSVANALWGQADYTFLPEFLDTLALNYGAGLRLLDFVAEGNREQSRQTINRWVSDRTAGKIEELLEEGVLTEDTRLVLTNAIYFKAEWEEPFSNGTHDAPFTLPDGSQVDVPMMSRRAQTDYAEGPDYQAVALRYKGDRVRMLILFPAPGQFEVFESTLTAERVSEISQALTPGDLKLYMPTFSYDASFSLADTLAQMGMPDAFDSNVADFSGMDGTHNLYISHVIHKAFVAVDEIGTEASAATGIVAEIESVPLDMRLDRPFIFLIHDVESDTFLFVGRLVDPRGDS